MMQRLSMPLFAVTLSGLVGLATTSSVQAQNAETASGSASRGRSTSERVNTEAATPPPVNSDYRRAAEGTMPAVPGGTLPIGSVPVPGGSIDPAVRPLPGVNGDINRIPVPGMGGAALPPGMDVAMMIEHALGMGLDSSILASLAQGNKPDDAGNDSVKALLTHAQDEMKESKDLLGKAAQAGNAIDANSPIRKFYHAASNYMTTLAALSEPGVLASPNDKAELAMINHSVKAVMDAGHISQFAGMGGPSPAMDGLLSHAKMMKDEGTKSLEKLAGTNPLDPSAPPSPIILAQKGRDLINAANALAPMMGQAYGANGGYGPGGMQGVNGTPIPGGQGPNPGRLQNNRPEIIGGTYGTGSQTSGTATGGEAARNVKNSTEGPGGVLNVPTPDGTPGSGPSGYGVGNNNTPPTQSTAGSRPR